MKTVSGRVVYTLMGCPLTPPGLSLQWLDSGPCGVYEPVAPTRYRRKFLMAEAKSGQIVNVMKEARLFPPPKEFAAKARIGSMEQYEKLWKEAAGDLEGFWGKMAERAALVQALHEGAGVERAVRQVVRRRADERLVQLPRRPPGHARGRTRRRLIWEGEPGDTRVLHLPDAAPRGLQVRQRAEEAGRRARATSCRSTCRWSPSWPSPCWPAPGSARSTRSSSAVSRPKRSPTATTTPRPSCRSRPTPAGGAASSCR